MGEFELIEHYFKTAPCAVLNDHIPLGIGDDCALLKLSNNTELAISTDTLVADVHFPSQATPSLIAQRALAVTVSDLAAMGAKPLAFTLALTLPNVDKAWLKSFAEGLSIKATQCAISLIGGDTTKGPLSITMTVLGEVPCGMALRRSGAKQGDLLCVSGCLGDGAAALPMVLGNKMPIPQITEHYWSPFPQLALGLSLRNKATACIDISDGLLADCGHIANASQVALVVELAKLPISDAVKRHYDKKTYQYYALAGGDDYQLAFTLPEEFLNELLEHYPSIKVIGRVEHGAGVKLLADNGQPIAMDARGYQHF